jgi:hypothetical protein
MKKVMIGGFTALVGALGVLAVFLAAALNPSSGWSTPPGRFMTSVSDLDLMPALTVSGLLVALGLVVMGIEYFRKDTQKESQDRIGK